MTQEDEKRRRAGEAGRVDEMTKTNTGDKVGLVRRRVSMKRSRKRVWAVIGLYNETGS